MLEKMKIIAKLNLKHRRATSLKSFKEIWIVNTNILINTLIRKTMNILI